MLVEVINWLQDVREHLRVSRRRNKLRQPGQGFDYILRVGEKWPMLVVGECLYSYRIHESSATRSDARRRRKKVQMVRDRAARRRGLEPTGADSGEGEGRHSDQEHGVVTHFMESVLSLRRAGSPRRALAAAWQCLALHPADTHYYKPLIYALVPMWLIRRYRHARGFQQRRVKVRRRNWRSEAASPL